MSIFLSGFGLGISLIAAIGAQNAFVLRQGILGNHVAAVVAACALSDALLIALGVSGFGLLTRAVPWISAVMLWGGVAFLAVYGARSFRAAFGEAHALMPDAGAAQPLWPVMAACLAFTWLNPHVYLDTVVLVGSVSAQYPQPAWFAAGAMTASLVFFSALGFGARLLRPLFARPLSWRVLEVTVGVVMWSIALRLALTALAPVQALP